MVLKLSRGLTLEGLVVSHFYRRSVMYDSLAVNGRWYGYRDDIKICYVFWITSESLDWYAHISKHLTTYVNKPLRCSAERWLRQLIFEFRRSQIRAMVTAATKMRTAKLLWPDFCFDNRLFGNRLCWLKTRCVIENNFDEFSNFLGRIADKRYSGSDILKSTSSAYSF